jgi:alpha-glucosidase (family GH31 glycosyl hydrolase)
MCLLPYLHAAFAEYERTGMPPFRALLMDYPGDPMLENVDDEYMVGDRILVAPIFAGEAERKVVFPSGEWQDFWTGKTVTGRTQTVPAAAPNIPVYVRAGSLMPGVKLDNTRKLRKRVESLCGSMETARWDGRHPRALADCNFDGIRSCAAVQSHTVRVWDEHSRFLTGGRSDS